MDPNKNYNECLRVKGGLLKGKRLVEAQIPLAARYLTSKEIKKLQKAARTIGNVALGLDQELAALAKHEERGK